MVLVNNLKFFHVFLFGKKTASTENVFDYILDILESKKAILNLVHVVTL